VFSVGASKCLLTWASAFTPTKCVAEPDEVAVLYPCGGQSDDGVGTSREGARNARKTKTNDTTNSNAVEEGHVVRRAATPNTGAKACPGDGNQLWELDTYGRLANTGVPGGLCLDGSLTPPRMAPCSSNNDGQRWTVRSTTPSHVVEDVDTDTMVQLESVGTPGMCLSSNPGPVPAGASPLRMQSHPATLSYGNEAFIDNVGTYYKT
jgi:hypothetical protein